MALNIKADRVNEINEAASNNDFTPVPDGSYCASLVSAEDCTREAKNGNTLDYIKCHFKLEGGQYNNRREFDDLVYSNSGSEKHGEIGIARLSQLFSALGGKGDLTVAALSALTGCIKLTIKTVPSKDPQYGPKRSLSFGKCDTPCDVAPVADAPPAADGGGDIWS